MNEGRYGIDLRAPEKAIFLEPMWQNEMVLFIQKTDLNIIIEDSR